MPAQRKPFRIEEIMQADDPMESARDGDVTAAHNELLAEIRALRASIEARLIPIAEPLPEVQSQEARKLKIELDVIDDAIRQTRSEIVSLQDRGFDSSRVARVARELESRSATPRWRRTHPESRRRHRRKRNCAERNAEKRQ